MKHGPDFMKTTAFYEKIGFRAVTYSEHYE